MKERPPTDEERRDLEQLVHDGIECLGAVIDLPDDLDDSAAVVQAIRRFVDKIHEGTALPAAYRDPEEAAYALGSLWGDEVRRAYGWEWVHLQTESGFEGWAVASPDRAYACLPHHFVFGKLADSESDNTIALLFNMMGADSLPPSAPGQYVMLG